MPASRRICAFLPVMFGLCCAAVTRADVAVLANRTENAMSAVVTPSLGGAQRLMIPAGTSVPVFVDGRAHVDFASRGRPKRYLLDANCAYYFGRGRDGGIDLQKIGLGEDANTINGRALPGPAGPGSPVVIPVKILVDEEETARQPIWERRLKNRVEAASAILERTCGVRFKVVDVGVWLSDNATTDFSAALNEFEREASPLPARLAIGFTSQFTPVKGRTHMAGTHGPLSPHILVREGTRQINEPERIEFLIHELGHFLGASHSPEKNSVMRPVLGDNLAGTAGYRVRFDPVNTLIMSMVSEEMRRKHAQSFSDLSPDTKRRLKQIYGELVRAFPDDPASQHFIGLIGTNRAMPQAVGTKRVLDAIARAAVVNSSLPPADAGSAGPATRRVGDRLTEYYVRQAAAAAQSLPSDIAASAFLQALGAALGGSHALGTAVAANSFAIETPRDRQMRLAMLGEPTIHGRHDLAQHFFASLYLATTAGAASADAAGLAKELLDANVESGFSFADLAADRAGVRFAKEVADKKLPLPMLAQSFSVPAFVPAIEGLPEKLTAKSLTEQFGAQHDERFKKQLEVIDRRILQLPPYQPTGPVLRP